jgi:SAM-dependent methyltransferase
MNSPPPDWRLPAGVNRALWDYVHDPAIAANYEQTLAGSTLFQVDQRFVQRHCAPPGRLIDLGCGTGRLLIPLAQQGYRVLGVDLSEEMLRVVGARAAEAGVVVHRLKANLVELDGLADWSFDYGVCLFSTLGMLHGADARRRALGHAHRLLRPGGKFVLHVHNRWFNVWDPQGRKWLLASAIRTLLGQEPAGDRTMPVHQGVAGLTLHLFTRREAVRLVQDVGFRLLEVQPVSLRPDGRLPWPALFGRLRAYGYLLAAERP